MDHRHRQALAHALDRRTVLRGLGAAGLASAGLSACTGPNQRNPRLPDQNAQATVAKSAVPVGSGIIVDKFIVTQPTAGTFAAYSATCPHQGCLIDQVQGQTITCPCHGSQFSTTDGSMRRGPATTPLTEARISDQGANLHITAG